jgi:lipopolysaccharide/colanic/teichoic acid biosynthesis glycosyltransferase
VARSVIDKNVIFAAEPDNAVIGSSYLRARLKRVTDLIFGFIGILTTLAALPAVALLIKIDSRGPIFYRQQRLGLDGRLTCPR